MYIYIFVILVFIIYKILLCLKLAFQWLLINWESLFKLKDNYIIPPFLLPVPLMSPPSSHSYDGLSLLLLHTHITIEIQSAESVLLVYMISGLTTYY